jgi:hypothetical protein
VYSTNFFTNGAGGKSFVFGKRNDRTSYKAPKMIKKKQKSKLKETRINKIRINIETTIRQKIKNKISKTRKKQKRKSKEQT